MFGLDDQIAALSSGGSILIVVLVAILLGLRHATDPDHIAAITTLWRQGARTPGVAPPLSASWWGLGHAVTLVVFGRPDPALRGLSPGRLQRGAETAVAALIVFLGVRVLVRHRLFIAMPCTGRPRHRHKVRTPFAAFGIGLVHGMGGSAGVGVLLLAAIPSKALAVASLVVLAFFTAVSMTVVTTGFGATLASPVRAAGRCRSGGRHDGPRLRILVRGRCVEPDALPVLVTVGG